MSKAVAFNTENQGGGAGLRCLSEYHAVLAVNDALVDSRAAFAAVFDH